MDTATALDRLAKVELHCHVEGTMRPETVVELAHKNDLALPAEDPQRLYRYSSLDTFLEVFWLVQSCLADQDDWMRLAYESVLDGAAHGLIYREAFFTPTRHLAAGQDLADIIAGLDHGLAAGEAETGARTTLICDVDRAFGREPAVELATRLADLRRDRTPGTERVIGFGMDSTELGVDPVDFADAFDIAGRAGLRRTSHQGEVTPPKTIAAGLDALGCERIDHGLSILDDPDLTQRAADSGIPLTVCPNSNILIANAYPDLTEHPYPQMRASGLLATLNTDDPALTFLDLGKEYRSVMDAFGYGWQDMVTIALDGVEAAWLDDEDKRALRARVQASADELGAER